MITTLRETKEKIARLLNDEVVVDDYGITGGTTYDADLITDAIRAALDALSSRMWKSKSFTYEANNDYFEMPDDILEIFAVYDYFLGIYIPKQQMLPGLSMLDAQYQNSWIDIPAGDLVFSADLGEDGALVYYIAAWQLPEDEEEPLEPPEIALNAILFYACSYCLLQQASGISTIRQYNTKVDSGKPIDNPTNEMANYFLRRFESEMQRFPLRTREQMQ